MQCTPVGKKGPDCPPGWESVGYTNPGSCTIGNAPGDGPLDTWQMYGYNRVCKRTVPTSGDMGVDCCSNIEGIAGSVECNSRGFNPYSDTCNNIMVKKCNSNVHSSPYGPEWNGMPEGQSYPAFSGCTGKVRYPPKPKKAGCTDKYCVNYLRNAPPGNFFHDHDYEDYPYHFPNYSYTTPDFAGSWGYQPERTPYKPYHEYDNKLANSYCQRYPQDCKRF